MAASTDGAGPDTVGYGVTDKGFIVKPLGAILDEAYARARQVFGPDIDLRSSSTTRKLIELAMLEPALGWMQLDAVYHSAFTSTASGVALDLLGADLGLGRAYLPATGTATLKLAAAAPKNNIFTLPPGTLVETAPPQPQRFRLLTKVTLVKHDPADGSERAGVAVGAVTPGPAGNIAASQLARINPTFAARYLTFDPTLVTVSNTDPFTGGDQYEDDSAYRRQLQALPRTLWTADAIRAVVLALDGVRDALVYDPYGGLDQATPPFGEFCFRDANFQMPRDLCNPYFFNVVVAPNRGALWQTEGDVVGLSDQILAALQPIRPISIFPTLSQADVVEVALRVTLVLQAGADPGGVLTAARTALANYVGGLRLGDAVLYAQVLRILAETPGVTDVQDLRLRRCATRFGEVVYGPPARFANDTDLANLEAPCGGNLTLDPHEVAVFDPGSPLFDAEVQSA